MDMRRTWYGEVPIKVSQYHFGEIQRLRNIAETKDKTLMLNMFAEYELPWIKGVEGKTELRPLFYRFQWYAGRYKIYFI